MPKEKYESPKIEITNEKETVDVTPSHGNTRLPFGLCMKYGITIGDDWTPRDCWDALAEKGITPEKVYNDLKTDGKVNETKPADSVTSESEKSEQRKPFQRKELSKELIDRANGNSQFNRGDTLNKEYNRYADKIEAMNISDDKKQSLLDELYKRYLPYATVQANHVPWTVAGPARYNSSLDKSSQIAARSKEFSEWWDKTVSSLENFKKQYEEKKVDNSVYQRIMKSVEDNIENKRYRDMKYDEETRSWRWEEENNPSRVANALLEVAKDKDTFVSAYEKYNAIYKFRKNTQAAKLYEQYKSGNDPFAKYEEERKAKPLFEDSNLNAYQKKIDAGERVFMKFATRAKPQLIYALKSRGWRWNANEGAWGIPANKYDEDFVKGISTNYSKYI